tara:strand:+ start:647 stop:1444 length:798 start_codon:yes stop_codon:yes gene_type:complete
MRIIKFYIKKIFSSLGYDIIFSNPNKQNNFTLNQSNWPTQRENPITFFEADKSFHEVYNLAQEKTQMWDTDNALRRQRHYTLNYLLKCAPMGVGDVCEVGCFRGLSSYQIASYLKENHENSDFHIFDSFEGLSDIRSMDDENIKMEDKIKVQEQFACSLKIVRENLQEFNFIKFYPGWIPERFKEVEQLVFSFVHIDADLYQPIYDSIKFFYPRMIKNGIMVFDDYGSTYFTGAKRAVDKYIHTIKNHFFLPLPSGQAFLIKNDQ